MRRRSAIAALAVAFVSLGCLAAELPAGAPGALAAAVAAYDRHDYAQARALLAPLADQGVARAEVYLGLLYETGNGEAQSYDAALAWYRKAAAQQDSFGEFLLGVATQLGHGLPADLAAAAEWYRRAVDHGDLSALINLGYFYEAGLGVAKDPAQAATLYRRAAERGSAVGAANLAQLYLTGNGVPKDYPQAALWNQRAAAQGFARGEMRLGLQYMEGLGVSQNLAEAHRLLYLAADQREPTAFFLLGALAENGQGEPKNAAAAYVWYSLAATAKQPQAPAKRDAIALQLAPAERSAADARIAAWQPGMRLAASGPQRVSTGSGFFVGADGDLLTNRHVVEGCGEIRLAGGGTAAPVASDQGADLALLRAVGAKAHAAAALRNGAEIRAGDAVVVAGYPYGEALGPDLEITTGTVTTLSGPGGDRTMLQFSAPVQPGNSGGPLLDLSGHLVGIVTSKLNALRIAQITGDLPQNINFGIALPSVRKFLEAQGVKPTAAPSDKPLSAADVGALATKFTVEIECWK